MIWRERYGEWYQQSFVNDYVVENLNSNIEIEKMKDMKKWIINSYQGKLIHILF